MQRNGCSGFTMKQREEKGEAWNQRRNLHSGVFFIHSQLSLLCYFPPTLDQQASHLTEHQKPLDGLVQLKPGPSPRAWDSESGTWDSAFVARVTQVHSFWCLAGPGFSVLSWLVSLRELSGWNTKLSDSLRSWDIPPWGKMLLPAFPKEVVHPV